MVYYKRIHVRKRQMKEMHRGRDGEGTEPPQPLQAHLSLNLRVFGNLEAL